MAEANVKAGFVVDVVDVEPVESPGDTVTTRVMIDAATGSARLTQRVLDFAPGRSRPYSPGKDTQEILYVVRGQGTLHLNGSHELEPDTAAYVLPFDSYEVDNPGPEVLTLVSVLTPLQHPVENGGGDRKVIVRFRDQPRIPVGGPREFRYLVNEDMGSRDVTQFVGLVQPSRTPEHFHEYDEVAYLVEGEGAIHMGELEQPVRAGTCIFFPRQVPHCLENSGKGVMRVMGVFHPSGSPGVHYVTEER